MALSCTIVEINNFQNTTTLKFGPEVDGSLNVHSIECPIVSY